MNIEELARTEPGAIIRAKGDPFIGLHAFKAREIFGGLGFDRSLMRPMSALLIGLGDLFVHYDCSLIELNPLGLCTDGRLVAADVKMTFDDNAVSRHAELADLRDPEQEDPREAEAQRYDLSYIGLDGSVGCMVNGAGLAMATMDLLRLHGAAPANFLDVGGNATAEKVAAAFRIICRDEHVKAILVNIFGGIVRCDLVAEGILDAVQKTELRVPLVVRLEGTNAEQGRKMLSESNLAIAAEVGFDDAARRAAELANA
jgi:succinyl-CoA synthetase beta subunit